MLQYFKKYTLLFIYCAFVCLNNKLKKMYGTYNKVGCIMFYKSLEFAWRSREIPRKTLVRVAGVPVEIPTPTLPNTSLEFTATWTRSFVKCFVNCCPTVTDINQLISLITSLYTFIHRILLCLRNLVIIVKNMDMAEKSLNSHWTYCTRHWTYCNHHWSSSIAVRVDHQKAVSHHEKAVQPV